MTLSAITLLYLPSFTYFPNTSNKYCPKPVKPRTVLHHSSGTGPGGHVPHVRDRSLRQHFAEATLPCSFPCPFPLTATAANVVSDVPAPFPLPHCSTFVRHPLLTLWATFPPMSVQHSPSTSSVGSRLFPPPHCPTIGSHPSSMLLVTLLPYPYRRAVPILDVVASLSSSRAILMFYSVHPQCCCLVPTAQRLTLG